MNTDWRFYKGTSDNAFLPSFDDRTWETVNIPHTWNNIDGQDGTPGGKDIRDANYFRGDGWYRKRFVLNEDDKDKLLFIRFQGANMQAEVFINGKRAGAHKGGYTAFSVDITPYVNFEKENIIAVRVNNEKTQDIAPLTADFTFYGGIYRDVELLRKNKVHFDCGEFATHGLKITTPTVTKENAECIFEAVVKNSSDKQREVTVRALLSAPASFEKNTYIKNVDFSAEKLTGENDKYEMSKKLYIASDSEEKVSFKFSIDNPHLWDGREYPYLYDASVSLVVDEKTVDEISDNVGFRFFRVDKEKGFFLNGRSYPLRGVSRHQDRERLGNALTKNEHDEDFSLIYDMGVTAVRLAHYPQAEYFYKLCDRYGIVVWAEIPFVDAVGGNGSYENPDNDRKAFFKVTKQQLLELMNQNFNHPSIVCWGLQNEVQKEYDRVMIPFMEELYKVGKEQDPYRLLTQATAERTAYHWKSDLMNWNLYPGWYGYRRTQLGKLMDKNRCDRPIGISEYGAGGNYKQHEERPKRIKHDGQWHPEEYQTLCHEAFLKSIDERPYLWATFVWNMFDFGSDGRNEGARPGMNDKGLVSFDRKVKKDSYFLYQSNWSKHPMVQIGESRYTERKKHRSKLKVYSNCESVTLYNNGKKLATKFCTDCSQKGIFVFRIKWHKGRNSVYAEAVKDGRTYKSEVEFIY